MIGIYLCIGELPIIWVGDNCMDLGKRTYNNAPILMFRSLEGFAYI